MFLVYWVLVYIIALICSLFVLIVGLITKRDSIEMLRTNRTLKLWHLPAHIFYLFCVFFFLGGGTFFPQLSLYFIFATVFLTGLVGLGGIIRGFCEKKLSLRVLIIHGALQFIALADIVSSIYLCIKVKQIPQKQECCATDKPLNDEID